MKLKNRVNYDLPPVVWSNILVSPSLFKNRLFSPCSLLRYTHPAFCKDLLIVQKKKFGKIRKKWREKSKIPIIYLLLKWKCRFHSVSSLFSSTSSSPSLKTKARVSCGHGWRFKQQWWMGRKVFEQKLQVREASWNKNFRIWREQKQVILLL